MISLVPTSVKKNWNILFNGIEIYKLNLSNCTLTNKFSIIKDLVDEMQELEIDFNVVDIDTGELIETKHFVFNQWFDELVHNYIRTKDGNYLYEQCPIIFKFAEKYVDTRNIDFDSFLDKKKSTKTSIIFYGEDIREIAISSTALKLYGIFQYDTILKPTSNLNTTIYKVFTRNCYDKNIINKIFQLMKCKTYNTVSMNSKALSTVIKMKSPAGIAENHMILIFNYLMSTLFVTLNITINPIPFMNSVVDASIGWLGQTERDKDIIYGDAYVDTDDVYGNTHSKHTFDVFANNDTIVKASEISANILKDTLIKYTDKYDYSTILDRIERVPYICNYMKLFNLVLVSNVLEIPYIHLLNISPKNAVLLSFYVYHLHNEIEKPNIISGFNGLYNLLIHYPTGFNYKETSQIIDSNSNNNKKHYTNLSNQTRSSNKTLACENAINDMQSRIFGIGDVKLKSQIVASMSGVFNIVRTNLFSIFTTKRIESIGKKESEIQTYSYVTSLYQDELKDYFSQLRTLSDEKYF